MKGQQSTSPPGVSRKINEPSNKLTKAETKKIRQVLLRHDLSDLSPREVYYKIMDEEKLILGSVSSFYRVARKYCLLTRRVKVSPKAPLNREEPHLHATGTNQIWSWDVSQIRSYSRLNRFYLYVIMDIWSRYVIAWKLEQNEKTDFAIELWKDGLEKQLISGKGLTNHKDNGSIMRSDEMLRFVKDAEMIDSYSRAGVSNDNPFSEALFKTIKYFRSFPGKFESTQIAQKYFKLYFTQYNFLHRHSGIQFITPSQRHYGSETRILEERNKLTKDFYQKNNHRYTKAPKIFSPIIDVKIN